MTYSATVSISLETPAGTIPLARVTPLSVESRDMAYWTGPATLVAVVDGLRLTREVVVIEWRGRVGEIEGSEG